MDDAALCRVMHEFGEREADDSACKSKGGTYRLGDRAFEGAS